MNFSSVEHYLNENKYEKYRLSQLIQSVQKGIIAWESVNGWSDNLKTELANCFPFTSWIEAQVHTSSDGTKKALLTLQDGQQIETVLMEPKTGHWSVCLSCEVGCPMNCAFCATGKMGFKRILTAEEITDQILFWKHHLQGLMTSDSTLHTINSIVFMGMGEPFHNAQEVNQAIGIFHDIYKFGYRHISVSTCGIPSEIITFGHHFPQLNLAISLHAANDTVRQQLMPIARNYSLVSLRKALLDYLRFTNRQIMFEYLLIDGINDRPQDQKALVDYLKSFPLQFVHVNLIRYNQTYRSFEPTPISRVKHWKQWLITHGISASIRKNLGVDIHGACGQLATTK